MPEQSKDDLSSIIDRFINGIYTDADIAVFRSAIDSGQVTIATGERAVAIGGNINDTIIATGDGNVFLNVEMADNLTSFLKFPTNTLSSSWFQNRLDEAIRVAGPRYTPPIHVELPISQIFDGLGRTDDFFIRAKTHLRDLRKEYSWIRLHDISPILDEEISKIQNHSQDLYQTILKVDASIIDPIPWNEISNYAKITLDSAQSAIKLIDEHKKKLRETKNDVMSINTYQKEIHKFRNEEYYLYRFIGKLRALIEFSQDLEARLSNLPALLLCGEAGQGKTHLFCDIASKRIAAGLPTVLLMGEHFFQEEPWIQIIRLLGLPETISRDDLLEALQVVAQAKRVKALIMIDALNEGDGKKIWYSYLPAMLETVSRYPWIGIAVSVRSSYEPIVIDKELENRHLIRAVHYGFAEHEYQATRTFFDHYGIEHPSVPLLVPEFQNPLFLKLLCKGLQEESVSTIPSGTQGITKIFDTFANAIDEKIWREHYAEFHSKPRRIVLIAVDAIAEVMAEKKRDWIEVEDAEDIVNQLQPIRRTGKSLYRLLVDEGILVENGHWLDQNTWHEVTQFAYEKFSDHLIAKHLLDCHLDIDKPELIFDQGQPLAFLVEDQWRNQGLIEALSVQIPERIGRELSEIAPMIAEYESVSKGFIESIIWRDPKAITESSKYHLNKCASQSDHFFDLTLNALLTVATNPEHPFNAEFLHALLKQHEMAERDAWWSIFLHEQYGDHDAVDRIVDWAWSPEDKSHIGDEALRLCGITLAWFLTTSNRFLRDRATKALVNLFSQRIYLLKEILELFSNVDDPYVAERLYAVAYGCALGSTSQNDIATLAQDVYDLIFQNGEPPAHILLRDYARGIIEFALHQNIKLNLEVDKFRPPYKSQWPSIPSEEEIKKYKLDSASYDSHDGKWSQQRIYYSVMADDFARYVIGTNTGYSKWLSLRIEDSPWKFPEEVYDEFILSLTENEKAKWDQFQSSHQNLKERTQEVLGNLTKEQLEIIAKVFREEENPDSNSKNDKQRVIDPEDELEIIELESLVHEAAEQLLVILDNEKSKIFVDIVYPFLNKKRQVSEPPRFDLSLAQRWILKRVFDLGWTIDRFGDFDRFYIGMKGDETRKPERIGKKYQWIAYHEFLARVSDNFQFCDRYSYHDKVKQYDGPWQIWVRDIDPSCVIKSTGRGDNWGSHPVSWWVPSKYSWELPMDDIEWMKKFDDLPDIESLIEVTNPENNSRWVTLDGFYLWEQPTPPEKEKFDIVRREFWYILNGYLVNKSDYDELFEWAIKQDYLGRWMPETHEITSRVFLGEFFWSPAYELFNDPYQRTVGWQGGDQHRRIPKPILPIADGYYQEDGGYDCSIDEGIRVKLPNQLIVEKMSLSWNGVEGNYYDQMGKLMALDPSVQNDGPSVLLMRRDEFLSFLDENNYGILWTVLGEKRLLGGWTSHMNKGFTVLSSTYRMKEGKLEGSITSRFHFPEKS